MKLSDGLRRTQFLDQRGNITEHWLKYLRERDGDIDSAGTAMAAAGDVTGQVASEGPIFAADGAVSSWVTVGFVAPSPVGTWVSVQLWQAGLNGGAADAPTLINTVQASPSGFELPSTKETITLYFVSVNADGIANDVLTSPSTTVTLDGSASAPLAVYGFAGVADGQDVRLYWRENLEADIHHYDIARRDSIGTPTESDIIARVIGMGSYST